MSLSSFSQLVSDIYDAALDPTLWRKALLGIGDFVGSDYVALISEDAAAAKSNIHYSSKDKPEWLEDYARTYVRLNPILVPPILSVEVGEVFSITSFMAEEEYLATRFYREWVRPEGYLDTIAAMLAKTPTGMTVVSAIQSYERGFVDDETRERMRLLVPHMRKAVTIGRIIEMNTIKATTLADVIDGFSAGIVLVDADRRVIHQNKGAETLFDADGPLRQTGGRLSIADAAGNAALTACIAACAEGDAVIRDKELAVAFGTHATDLVAHVLPLTSGTRRGAHVSTNAVAAIFVRRAEARGPLPLQTMARRYGLTTREMSVMLAIAEVGGVPAVSSVLGLSETTVKSYLHSIYQKTGAKRQADLVKIVDAFGNPFSGAGSA